MLNVPATGQRVPFRSLSTTATLLDNQPWGETTSGLGPASPAAGGTPTTWLFRRGTAVDRGRRAKRELGETSGTGPCLHPDRRRHGEKYSSRAWLKPRARGTIDATSLYWADPPATSVPRRRTSSARRSPGKRRPSSRRRGRAVELRGRCDAGGTGQSSPRPANRGGSVGEGSHRGGDAVTLASGEGLPSVLALDERQRAPLSTADARGNMSRRERRQGPKRGGRPWTLGVGEQEAEGVAVVATNVYLVRARPA